MIEFYYNLGPNPMKVALLLEEAEMAYDAIPVDMLAGDQFGASFAALNPNNKVPVIVDDGAVVFDSNAILLYLAGKSGAFIPDPGGATHGAMLSWLMFIATGLGPYSGQAVHFRHYAPKPNDYAEKRYLYEARRHYRILDDRLADRPWMLGERYGIVDMALWGWARNLAHVAGEDAPALFPNVARLVATISDRPAAHRVEALRARHSFQQQADEAARQRLFGHLKT